jgi:glycosyltransferase involved in cell wall biosynthesis
MRFTILTQYYPPETGAPQNRLHSLARNLVAAGHEVEVLTAMPNYPKMRIFDSYRGRVSAAEEIDGITVRRSWIYVSRSKAMVPRLVNYFSFVVTSLIAGLRVDRSDYLICESPPLFLGMSAWVIARGMGARLIFNVSDLWPETAEKLGIVGDGLLLRIAYRLEAWLYRQSHLVTGQTQGIVDDIARRFPEVPVFWLPNGIDEDVVAEVEADSEWRTAHGLKGRKVFMYAGILGHAQGLEVMVKAAARLKEHPDLAFVIVGDGPLKDELEKLNRELAAGVVFIPNTPKNVVLRMVADVYAYVVVLKKLDLFKGAIPSKLFDPLALGVPILLGVEGEAKNLFIDAGKAGVAVEPENDEDLAEAARWISDQPYARDEMGRRGRDYVAEHFNRRLIAARFLDRLGH